MDLDIERLGRLVVSSLIHMSKLTDMTIIHLTLFSRKWRSIFL